MKNEIEEIEFNEFVSNYFESAFKITFFLAIFKIFGITSNSWLWTTILLWFPFASMFLMVLILGMFFYVGFLVGCLGNFLKDIFRPPFISF